MAPPHHKLQDSSNISHASWVVALFVVLITVATYKRSASLSNSSDGSNNDSRVDAIIVLGGGLKPDGSPPPWMESRCKVATHEYNIARGKQTKNPVIITLSGGTTWKPPPKDENGFPITEASSSAQFLILQLGVPLTDVYEVMSFLRHEEEIWELELSRMNKLKEKEYCFCVLLFFTLISLFIVCI
jgi:hypothetical protein